MREIFRIKVLVDQSIGSEDVRAKEPKEVGWFHQLTREDLRDSFQYSDTQS